LRRDRRYAYTRTSRDQIALYSVEPNVVGSAIDSREWYRIGRKDIFKVEFFHKRALFTVRFIDYKEYILILSIHKTTSRNAIKKAKSK
jgi:hypothetical protein